MVAKVKVRTDQKARALFQLAQVAQMASSWPLGELAITLIRLARPPIGWPFYFVFFTFHFAFHTHTTKWPLGSAQVYLTQKAANRPLVFTWTVNKVDPLRHLSRWRPALGRPTPSLDLETKDNATPSPWRAQYPNAKRRDSTPSQPNYNVNTQPKNRPMCLFAFYLLAR